MILETIRFEMVYRLRRPLLYIFALFFFMLTFGAVSTDSVMLGGSIGNVARNAPYVIVNMLIVMSTIGLLFVTIFVAPSVNRDHEGNIQELFFSTPLGKRTYLLGRYLGSVIPVILAMLMSCAGIYLASIMPWQDPGRIAPFTVWPYVYGMLVFVVPNLVLSGAFFFSVATLTRKTFSAYVAVIAFLSLWGIGAAFMGDLEHQTVASVLDPFGWGAFRVMTRYWTIVERNTMMLGISGPLLVNRILWLSVAAAVMAFTLAKYRMALRPPATREKDPEDAGAGAAGGPGLRGPIHDYRHIPPEFTLEYGRNARMRQFLQQVGMETRGILKSLPFSVILMFGAANLLTGMFINVGGTSSFPLTQQMLEYIDGAFALMPWLVIIIYGGELVWRDRRVRISEIVDTLPVPDWIPVASKLTALFSACFVLAAAALCCTVAFQLSKGYFHIEPLLYIKGLFLLLLGEWILLCVLSIFLQVFTGNRYVGTLLMVACLVSFEVLDEVGLNHRLYQFAQIPRTTYSDMNGYGHFAAAVFWFRTYWTIFAAGLAVLASLLWIRGTENRLRLRLAVFRRRLKGRAAASLAVITAAFILTGAWIYYNTNVLNDHTTRNFHRAVRAGYEKRYGRYEGIPQPKVVSAELAVDIYPGDRRVDIAGTLMLVNRTGTGIDSLHLSINREIDRVSIDLPGAEPLLEDRMFGYSIYRLGTPLAPGDSIPLRFDLGIEERGFENNDTNVRIVGNGTFFINTDYVPIVGYFGRNEIDDPVQRKNFGLEEKERMPAVDDTEALQRIFTPDADRIMFEAVVSTERGQTAIAPGYLEREWTDGGRRYFHYRMDRPMLNLYCFLSGRYEKASSEWNGIPVEVFYHRTHGMNVERMIEAVTKSLEYYSSNFSPYPFRQVRIVEFPGYRSFAMALAGTIPYSESARFIDDLSDEDDLDMVFYITAHEMGHQWWAHQVTPAYVQGDNLIAESLTQYSALMVMEKDYGPDRMKKFLRYELDSYLTGRSGELKDEMPIMLSENQPYIHYRKGSLVMYALREYIGEDDLNSALRDYIDATAFRGPPYTNTVELLSCIRPAVPGKYGYLIEDLFETITLYDNRLVEASFERTGDGRFLVRLHYMSRKLRADGKGVEKEIPHEDWIEIGVYGEETVDGKSVETTLHREKYRLASGEGIIELVVDSLPVRAGIDPRNILIDRVPGDNVRKADEK